MSKKTTEADSLRTVHLQPDDRETLASAKDTMDTTASAIIRTILKDYVAGKLRVVPTRAHKTSVLVDDELWAQAVAKSQAEKTSISRVVAAGIARLRARR
jgi:hypothetical protein